MSQRPSLQAAREEWRRALRAVFPVSAAAPTTLPPSGLLVQAEAAVEVVYERWERLHERWAVGNNPSFSSEPDLQRMLLARSQVLAGAGTGVLNQWRTRLSDQDLQTVQNQIQELLRSVSLRFCKDIEDLLEEFDESVRLALQRGDPAFTTGSDDEFRRKYTDRLGRESSCNINAVDWRRLRRSWANRRETTLWRRTRTRGLSVPRRRWPASLGAVRRST